MFIDKETFKNQLFDNVKMLSRKTIENASEEQVYEALVFTVRDYVTDRWIKTHEKYHNDDVKVVYYLSMEFLMGRFLGNTVLNLSVIDEIKEILKNPKLLDAYRKSMDMIKDRFDINTIIKEIEVKLSEF